MKKKNILLGLTAAVLALGLASCGNDNDSSTKTEASVPASTDVTPTLPASDDAKKVLTHAEYLATADAETVTIKGTIQERQTYYNGASLYLTDKDGGYFIYSLPCTEEEYKTKLVKGAVIEVTGYKNTWCGEVEIVGNQEGAEATWKVVDETSTTLSAKDVTGKTVAELEVYNNDYVKFNELTVVGKEYAAADNSKTTLPFFYKWDNSGKAGGNCDLYYDLTDGTNTFTFVVESYLESTQEGSELYTAVTSLTIGTKVNVEGFLYWYEGPQLHTTVLKVVA